MRVTAQQMKDAIYLMNNSLSSVNLKQVLKLSESSKQPVEWFFKVMRAYIAKRGL